METAHSAKEPGGAAPLESVLQELETQLTRYEAEPDDGQRNLAKGMYRAGYANGLRSAINVMHYEIGIRQNPPNINYPGERPQ
jgi:hypothetical protein